MRNAEQLIGLRRPIGCFRVCWRRGPEIEVSVLHLVSGDCYDSTVDLPAIASLNKKISKSKSTELIHRAQEQKQRENGVRWAKNDGYNAGIVDYVSKMMT